MIVAATILLTVPALIRCISEGSIRDNMDRQSQSMVERFHKEKNFLFFPNRERGLLSNRRNGKAGTA